MALRIFRSYVLCNGVAFFANFAPQKPRKPLTLLVNFGNGRAMPLPQHGTPGHRLRDAPPCHRKSRQRVSTEAITPRWKTVPEQLNQTNDDRCARCAA